MSLLEKFQNDLISAMKSRDKFTLQTLRTVKGALQLEVINKKLEETDDLLLSIINKQIKIRRDSIVEFEKGNRNDLVESYSQEIDILSEYMPSQLTEVELEVLVKEIIDEAGATSMKDFGLVMKTITPKVKNKCDMSKLSKIIKEKIMK